MGLLAGTCYDPATAATLSLNGTPAALTAVDTTNLRLSFTVPASGDVMVRMAVPYKGSTTLPALLFGVLEAGTGKGRAAPSAGMPNLTAATTKPILLEAVFVVTGLTPGASLTWDAAVAVQTISGASGALAWGGPNNATTNDAWGGFRFEIWDAPALLAAAVYDPGAAVTKATTALQAMTVLDTTNLRNTFTVPASGKVLVRLAGVHHGDTACPALLFGVIQTGTVKGRASPDGTAMTALATALIALEANFIVSGLTPGASLTWDAAMSVEVVAAAGGIKYGGPNNTAGNNAFGSFRFEIWDVT